MSKEKFEVKDLQVTGLNKSHIKIIRTFQTYEKDLSDFLVDDALKNQKLSISKTFLFFDKTDHLLGYITLLNDSINLNANLKKYFNEKDIPYKSLPALKIGRLCVDDRYSGKGIGTILIDFAVFKAKKINEEHSGCRFITLDAKRSNDGKKEPLYFYKKLGFEILKERNKGSIPMYFDLEYFK